MYWCKFMVGKMQLLVVEAAIRLDRPLIYCAQVLLLLATDCHWWWCSTRDMRTREWTSLRLCEPVTMNHPV